jgi:hypothetical protein
LREEDATLGREREREEIYLIGKGEAAAMREEEEVM